VVECAVEAKRRRGGEVEWWRGGLLGGCGRFYCGGDIKPNFLNLLFETYFENKVT
jgi:hypothetical protein